MDDDSVARSAAANFAFSLNPKSFTYLSSGALDLASLLSSRFDDFRTSKGSNLFDFDTGDVKAAPNSGNCFEQRFKISFMSGTRSLRGCKDLNWASMPHLPLAHIDSGPYCELKLEVFGSQAGSLGQTYRKCELFLSGSTPSLRVSQKS